MKKHPFIDSSITPNWEAMTPEHVEGDITYALEQAKGEIQKICDQDLNKLTYESTLQALDEAVEPLSNAWGKVMHLDSVCNSDELRKAQNTMLPIVSNFFSELQLNDDLWKVIEAYSKTEEPGKLSAIKKRHFEEVVADFKEAGADLPKEKKDLLIGLNAELSKLTQEFSEHVLDATNEWELVIDNEEDLAGLPESAKEAARHNALSKGYGTEESPKWRITLHAPSMMPVLQYLESDEIRKQVWEASSNVGRVEPHSNKELVHKILKARHEKAEILGKENFADLILQRRMAREGKQALGFIENLHTKVEDFFKKDIDALEKYKAEKTNSKQEHFNPWEMTYWAEKRQKELYDFDPEELRPYFSIDKVINGMFEITQKIFGIKLQEKKEVSAWHEDVKYYELHDAENGKLMGAFYADWHPRETKRGGAWMNCLLTGGPSEPHLGLICGNLTPPLPGKPALLTHYEVVTIFHEFGHLLHHLLGEMEVKSLNGIHVVWDFVELPSQLLENWCWERESLDLFARHYETGEAIPEELYKRMLVTRNYLSGMGFMRQLCIAKMDLELHINYNEFEGSDLDETITKLLNSYIAPFKTTPPPLTNRLTHVFADPTGYAAGYYSYKWAEVLDADAFTKFKKEGILNPEVGKAYRTKILSKGNSEPAELLFRDFMGRNPDPEALLERSNLVK